MGDFSYELPSQPAIDAAAQVRFQIAEHSPSIKCRQPIKERP